MFDKLSIKNFKNISEWQNLELSSINLIYGPNSAGKTSIIQALLILQQTFTRPSITGGLVTNGYYAELGSYPVIVYKHDKFEDIEFSINYTVKKKNKNDYIFLKRDFYFKYSYFVGSKLDFSYLSNYKYSFEFYTKENKKIILNNSFVSCLKKDKILNDENKEKDAVDFKLNSCDDVALKKILGMNLGDDKKISEITKYYRYNSNLNYSVPATISIDFEIKPKESIPFDNEQFKILPRFNNIVGMIANEIKENFKNISYIGPLRSKIQKAYIIKNDYEVTVGKEGENIAYFFYKNERMLVEEINNFFNILKIPYIISVNKIGDDETGPIISIKMFDIRTNTVVSPTEIGFGISQILPILVEGIVRKNSTICVEQPEIHVHPKLQAELAEFFVATSTENQWIIETHSEALLLRIQKLIRNKKEINGKILKPNDVSIFYILPTEIGSKVIRIRLDEDGDFMDIWPEGFFEERIKERK